MIQNRTFNIDANLILKTAGLIAASAAVATIKDLGGGFTEGMLVIDITAIEIASNTEVYTLILEGSINAAMGSTVVPLAWLQVGANEVIVGGCDVDSTIGRYIIPWTNMRDDTVYRYVRMYTIVAGTVDTDGGINYKAYLSKKIGGG